MNYVIEFSDGSHGILPNDNLEYSVTRGRVIVYKDGEKVLDKSIVDCPSGKCEIIAADNKAPEVRVLPVDGEVVNKDVAVNEPVNNEYNIGNMLPQGCGVVPTINQRELMTAESSHAEDGEVITEVTGKEIAIGAGIAAGAVGGLFALLNTIKLIEKGTDNIVTAAQRPKYKKVLDAYYNYFMVDKAPMFSSLTKKKVYTNEEGDKKPAVIGILKKYGCGKESAVVDYTYKDKDVCGCYMEKKYKASFDVFTFILNGGDVVKIDYGWTKHLQTKVFAYQNFRNYYIAYMHLSLGFIDNAFKDIVRDVKAEIRKHEKDIKDLKKESADIFEDDDMDITFTLTEAAIDYINDGTSTVEESAKDVILNFASEVNVSRKIRILIIEIALMKARLNVMTKIGAKPEKIASLKRDIIAKEKAKRALLEGQTDEVKSTVRKIEKKASSEAKKEVKTVKESEEVTESLVDVVPLVEEKEDGDNEAIKKLKAEINELKEEIAKLKNPSNGGERVNTSKINILKEKIEKLRDKLVKNRISLGKSKDEKEADPKPVEEAEELVPARVRVESDMDSNYMDMLSSFVNEAANIDDAIKDVIASLNAKGYKTRYSSAGHFKLRKKEDREPDGVYKGKLYSDARLQFKGTYHFGAAPKYWFWKKVDEDDYLDVVPITYNQKDGTPDEAFEKWRTNYLNSLETWAKNLPSADSKKDDEPTPEDKNIKEESVRITTELDNYFDSIFRENGIR